MRIDLDKAERLITRIRAAEASLEKLYQDWNDLNGSVSNQATRPTPKVKKGGRKPNADSMQSRVLAAIEKNPQQVHTVNGVALAMTEDDVDAVRRALDKLVFLGKIKRAGRGQYQAQEKEATEVAS